jgi:mRNA interferase HigB
MSEPRLHFLDLRTKNETHGIAFRGQRESGIHVISRKRLREFWDDHNDAREPLARWFKLAENAEWTGFSDLRADFPTADLVDQFIIINIGGNKYRLVLEIFFRDQVVLIRHVLTPADYDKGKWKR